MSLISVRFKIGKRLEKWVGHILPENSLRYLTIRLWARDFYEVIVDEAKGLINYRLIEIESEKSNCFSRILT